MPPCRSRGAQFGCASVGNNLDIQNAFLCLDYKSSLNKSLMIIQRADQEVGGEDMGEKHRQRSMETTFRKLHYSTLGVLLFDPNVCGPVEITPGRTLGGVGVAAEARASRTSRHVAFGWAQDVPCSTLLPGRTDGFTVFTTNIQHMLALMSRCAWLCTHSKKSVWTPA